MNHVLVKISGTFSKDERANNGLETIGEKLEANRHSRVAVVGILEFHGHHDVVGRPEYISVKFVAVEPLAGKDDTAARKLLDKARKARDLGPVDLTLFDGAGDDSPDGGEGAGEGLWPGDAGYDAKAEGAADKRRRTAKVQQTLPGTGTPRFDPLQHRLYRRFLDDAGQIDHAQWLRAIAEHAFVGTCRRCGDQLTPLRPTDIGGRTDYEAHCRRPDCGWVCNAPGGRYLRRSSRLHERR